MRHSDSQIRTNPNHVLYNEFQSRSEVDKKSDRIWGVIFVALVFCLLLVAT